MTFELADFEPETGHRHVCPSRLGADETFMTPRCDCAAELYAVAAARLDPSAVIEKIRPIDGDNILVVRGAEPGHGPESFGDQLVQELVRWARARGLTGPVAQLVPLVLILPASQSIEVLDEKQMGEHGWVRAGTTIKRGNATITMPPGAYS